MSGGVLVSYLGNILAAGQAVPQVVSAAFPLPVAISGGLAGLAVAGVQPAGVIATANPIIVAGIDGTGVIRDFLVDGSGILQVNATLAGGGVVGQGAGNTANPWTMQGPVAGGVATSGNPVKAGGVFNTTPPTYTTGQTGEVQLDPQGSVRSRVVAGNAAGADLVSNNSISAAGIPTSPGTSLNPFAVAGWSYNGSSWDRLAKPRTAFRLPSSAATNNAANIKASPGTVYSISANVTLAASTCYLKFFDTTGAPNPAALTPLYIFALNIVNGMVSFNLPSNGLYFPTGIGVAIVANPADLDNTAIAAGQVTALNVSFL